MSEHLKLPFYEGEFERKKFGGGRQIPREDRQGFSEIQIHNLVRIEKSYQREKRKFSQFFDPNLIFKIKLNQSVDPEEFTRFLERSGVRVIAPSPEKTGYWISLAEEDNLDKVRERLRRYGLEEKHKQIDAVEGFERIPRQEKIGAQLKALPLGIREDAYLDIEIWRMEDERLKAFLNGKGDKAGFKGFIEERGGKVTDEFKTKNLCLLRAKTTKPVVDEILALREISRIDRPPKPYISYELLSVPQEKLEIGDAPSKNATAIAVLDSGILSGHPLLEKAVGDEIAVSLLSSNKIRADKPADDVGHGTQVAGIALYGDVKRCCDNKSFDPMVWILSAKVMYREKTASGDIVAKYDESELLEHQLDDAVRYFAKTYSNCKVVNISFGDEYKKMFGNKRQFPLATLVDELANELGLVFVISAGNIREQEQGFPDQYPRYLVKENEEVKIIEPASSAYALTIGSITQEYGPSDHRPDQISYSPAKTNYPSPFTRVGLGYNGMIKPELVEEGGNVYVTATGAPDIAGKLMTLNHEWIKDGRLFTVAIGTSLCAPKVAHEIALLFNQFPDYSPNLIKALLLASATIPTERPPPLDEIDLSDSDLKVRDLLKVYGYGKPNLDRALASQSNRVLLLAESQIKLNGVHLYYVYLPLEFIETKGRSQLSVTLVYNPPVRRNRIDYLGVGMEFHLFRNAELKEVIGSYAPIKITAGLEDIVPTDLKLKRIELRPGVRLRKKGIHQKALRSYSGKRSPAIDPERPLVLAVISQASTWLKDKDYLQDYAVAVTVSHEIKIDLYNLIRQRVQQRVQPRLRVR